MLAGLVISTLLLLNSSSWIVVWLMLEINTMIFCMMMLTENSTRSKEMSMKYLVVQSSASALVLLTSLMMTGSLLSKIIILPLVMKMGGFPLQNWFLEMNDKIKTSTSFILMTWQKVAPLFLMSYSLGGLLAILLVLNASMGSAMMFGTKTMQELLSTSTISNIGWMMASLYVGIPTLLLFMFIYHGNMWLLFFSSASSKGEKSFSNSGLTLVIMLSVAGIPPMMGFIPKMNILVLMVEMETLSAAIALVMSSCLSVYLYLRLLSMSTSLMPHESNSSKSALYSIPILLTASAIMLTFS